jgi:hypothetical protein
MSKEALKLALEALETPHPGVRTSFTDSMKYREQCKEAITAIKQALAAQPAPVQEPVAWMYELIIDGEVCNVECTNVNWNPEYQPFGRAGIDFVEGGKVTKTPIYTAPPAQEIVCSTGLCHYRKPQEEQEPVAYEYGDDIFWHNSPDINDYIRANGKALVYTTPPEGEKK